MIRSVLIGSVVGLALLAEPAAAQGRGNASRVPPGHLPPAGACRVWLDGVAPGRQPGVTDCVTARRQAARYGGRVEWVGQVPYEEVVRYYRESDAFFFTSLRDSSPMQLLEAMAYALPVVTLDLHGQAELVSNETGLKVPVQQPEQVVADLARAIEWLYHHPDERRAMGRRGYAFARTQSWENKLERMVSDWYPPAREAVAEPLLTGAVP